MMSTIGEINKTARVGRTVNADDEYEPDKTDEIDSTVNIDDEYEPDKTDEIDRTVNIDDEYEPDNTIEIDKIDNTIHGTPIEQMAEFLSDYHGPEIKIMEVCGTHTAGIFKSGIRDILSDKIRLISGPGCPVCVTPTSYIDACIKWAKTPDTVLLSFGDMLKVPGEESSLSKAISDGANVRMIYSPFEAIELAKAEPEKTFIVAAVGFETTAPSYALLLDEVIDLGLANVKLLTALKESIPAIEWVLENEPAIDAFLCPGHVAVITGVAAFAPLAEQYRKPLVIGGFEPEHILSAIYEIVLAVEKTRNPVTSVASAELLRNVYSEAVSNQGNLRAQHIVDKYFTRDNAIWRGLGNLPNTGYFLKEEYARYDVGSRAIIHDKALPVGCACADVITGRKNPDECSMYAVKCTPFNPYGPCMVSSEGACGIWYRNR
ncbi:MAG: hydrogenase formation protein HypD [Clostridiales Family XIII bacterium]|jgi:hydrogenase expression/formation protein HypD|nr:hydrogenase formation protein HypD [Clostridiales Family XIII bacterium]